MKKTNAVRILDQHKVDYQLLEYVVDESDLSAETVAQKVGKPIETVFKTLVLRGDNTGNIVAIIPGNAEVDLKALAKLSGNKKCLMIAQKELLPLTGYIRGGVSPLGMKKHFPTFIDQSAINHLEISISGGVRGLQILINPKALIEILDIKTGVIST